VIITTRTPCPRVHGGVAVDHGAVGRHPATRANQDDVARLQVRGGDRSGGGAVHELGLVRQERRERVQRARGLPEGLHLLPVAQEHHVDQERELPPELEIQPAELRGQARAERHDDRERDQEHHAGLPVAELGKAALEEGQAAVDKDDSAEDGGDAIRQRERRRRVAEPVLDHLGPEQDRDREGHAQPEAVAEHGDVAAHLVAAALHVAHVHAGHVHVVLGVHVVHVVLGVHVMPGVGVVHAGAVFGVSPFVILMAPAAGLGGPGLVIVLQRSLLFARPNAHREVSARWAFGRHHQGYRALVRPIAHRRKRSRAHAFACTPDETRGLCGGDTYRRAIARMRTLNGGTLAC
jgi:hypothetical protein